MTTTKLTLGTAKAGESRPKLSLNLRKGALFLCEMYWDSSHDLDTHALLATNNGDGAKVSSYAEILSAYNLKKNDPANGVLILNSDGKSFGLPGGEILHSGDARSGLNVDIDEFITIDGSKIVGSANEIPIIITIHNAVSNGANFSHVTKAGIRIKDDNRNVICEYDLSTEFAKYNAVQMGSLILGANGWEFSPVGVGFNGDFSTVLGHFS